MEALSQDLKSTLLRHSKILLALLSAALVLLLYFTSLLSQLTLSETFVDIAIYIIYILLVMILGSIAFIAYCLFEEEPLFERNSYRSQGDVLNLDTLLIQKEESSSVKEQETKRGKDIKILLDTAGNRLIPGSERRMKGYALVEGMQTEKRTQYLNKQHPQIAAVILLMIDSKKAVTILEQMKKSQKDALVQCIENCDNVLNKALMILDEALQKELSPLQKECSGLGDLESAQIREILHHVDKKELMFALKGATQELQEKFFANMSSKASTEFKKVLASVSHIEETKSQIAIKNLYLLAQRLRENGKIRAIKQATG